MVRLGTDSAGLIDQIRGLENLKSAIVAVQARAAVAFDLAQRAEQAEAGVPASERGNGSGTQVALARRESPNRGPGCWVWLKPREGDAADFGCVGVGPVE